MTATPTIQAEAISTDEMVALLMGEKGATFVTFTHTADMSKTSKMRKGGNPYFGDCYKEQEVNGTVNFHFDKGVIRRLESEGKSPKDFEQGTSWHMPIFRPDGSLTPFCCHKKDPRRIYVRFMYLSTVESHYHKANGEEIAADEIKPFLPDKSRAYKNQGLEKPLIFNVWKVEDISEIHMNGKRYVVSPSEETARVAAV